MCADGEDATYRAGDGLALQGGAFKAVTLPMMG